MLQQGDVLREHLFSDRETLARELALAVAGKLRAALAARGSASLVVSGGRSPIPFFQALSTQPLDWSQVWVTLADERWVPPSSPDSNERLVLENLLTGAAAGAQWVPLKSSAASAAQALAERQTALAGMPHPFDCVVLGMGDDGHTASLFPGSAALQSAGNEWLAAVATPAPPNVQQPRMTMTLPLLLASRQIFLPLTGDAKWLVYRRARDGAAPRDLPVAAILGQCEVPVAVYWSC
ncbi:MAG: 6-phosphogluconolactonase [Sterolibacterium sp.]